MRLFARLLVMIVLGLWLLSKYSVLAALLFFAVFAAFAWWPEAWLPKITWPSPRRNPQPTPVPDDDDSIYFDEPFGGDTNPFTPTDHHEWNEHQFAAQPGNESFMD